MLSKLLYFYFYLMKKVSPLEKRAIRPVESVKTLLEGIKAQENKPTR